MYGNVLSRDLTVYLHTHAFILGLNEPYLPLPSQPKLVLIYRVPKGWKAELAWATRTVSKQSAQDCYAMFITAANRSKHHTSMGK